MSEDLYGILGVSPQAEPEVIRAAYRSLIAKYHPDRNIGFAAEAEARAKQLNHAYSVLSDAQKRSAYDRSRGAPKEQRHAEREGAAEAREQKPAARQPPERPPPRPQPVPAPPAHKSPVFWIFALLAVAGTIAGLKKSAVPTSASPPAVSSPKQPTPSASPDGKGPQESELDSGPGTNGTWWIVEDGTEGTFVQMAESQSLHREGGRSVVWIHTFTRDPIDGPDNVKFLIEANCDDPSLKPIKAVEYDEYGRSLRISNMGESRDSVPVRRGQVGYNIVTFACSSDEERNSSFYPVNFDGIERNYVTVANTLRRRAPG